MALGAGCLEDWEGMVLCTCCLNWSRLAWSLTYESLTASVDVGNELTLWTGVGVLEERALPTSTSSLVSGLTIRMADFRGLLDGAVGGLGGYGFTICWGGV